MGYVSLHLNKTSGTDAGMSAHIERTISPKNADPTRTHLNRELIEFPKGVSNRTQAIQYRLDNAGLKRKIGTNQVRAIRVILSGTHEDMKRIEAEGKLGDWCNDNLAWLHKTYGVDNLVSAVLHMDEKTPHLHATIVPIVTGERRKAKETRVVEPGKKRYRKKDPNAARLCADDVMSRTKLKNYQDTYAEAMAKYGLERGISGSEARHITAQQFNRDAKIEYENIQEDISSLLEQQENKRQAIRQLEEKEQEARARIKAAENLKHQKEAELSKTQAELKHTKDQLKTEKLKKSAADLGSSIVDGLGSVMGTSKVKKQQQEIEYLKSENGKFKFEKNQEIKQLMERIQTTEAEHKKATDKLKQELARIYNLFPHIKELLRIENLCKYLGFSESLTKKILEMKPVGFKGKLYSAEYKRHFETEHSEAEVKPHPTEPNKLNLTIDGVSDINWFRLKQKEFLQKIGINTEQKQRKGRSL